MSQQYNILHGNACCLRWNVHRLVSFLVPPHLVANGSYRDHSNEGNSRQTIPTLIEQEGTETLERGRCSAFSPITLGVVGVVRVLVADSHDSGSLRGGKRCM